MALPNKEENLIAQKFKTLAIYSIDSILTFYLHSKIDMNVFVLLIH